MAFFFIQPLKVQIAVLYSEVHLSLRILLIHLEVDPWKLHQNRPYRSAAITLFPFVRKLLWRENVNSLMADLWLFPRATWASTNRRTSAWMQLQNGGVWFWSTSGKFIVSFRWFLVKTSCFWNAFIVLTHFRTNARLANSNRVPYSCRVRGWGGGQAGARPCCWAVSVVREAQHRDRSQLLPHVSSGLNLVADVD